MASPSHPTIRTAPFVDAHVHPDKSSWGGPWLSRSLARTLPEFIAADLRTQRAYTRSVAERAEGLLRTEIENGTRALRAHVDVGPAHGLANIHGVREAAERVGALLDVQIVAFPQEGLLSAPGTLELLGAALREGADLVGGLDPVGIDGDLDGHLDAVFGLAAAHGVDIDIHLHDEGPEGLAQTRAIAARTVAAGLQGRVTISHAFAVATAEEDDLARIADVVAEARVWLTTCALGPDPVLPIEALRRAGVRVAVGSDGVRDAWTPFGTGSMADRAHLLAYRTGAMTDDELEHAFALCTTSGAELVGLRPAPGDALEFAAASIAEVVVDRPAPSAVLRDDRVVARDGALIDPA